ncbi:MAG: DUF4114 domain-containing protein, partial [Kamptonema sp. SIO4C4]|nr:DUF4114 domain-containing protein [Kamptonema sp. SIO4C4]
SNDTTTFELTLDPAQLGSFSSDVEFTTNDPDITEPFNFAVSGEVTSPLQVEQLDSNNQVVQTVADGTSQPINVEQVTTFRITNEGTQALNLGTPTSGSNLFTVNTGSFNTNLAGGASTTFTVALNSNQVGTFDDTVEFTVPNGTLQNAPFDFAVTGTVPSPIRVERLNANNQVVQTIADGTTQAINVEQATIFQITNDGNQAITLETPSIANDAFTVNLDSFNANLAAGESTQFTVQLNTETAGTFSDTVEFGVPSGALQNPPFDFAVAGTVPEDDPSTPPTSSQLLEYDPQTQRFTTGTEGDNLSFQVTGVNASQITQVSIVFAQEDGSLGTGENLFSLLPPAFQPSGFGVSQQDLFLSEIGANQEFIIELQRFDGTTLSREVEVTEQGESFQLNFAEGVSLTLEQTTTQPPVGVGDDQRQNLEVLDLEELSGSVSTTFTLYREAEFTNTVGLYRLDDESGAVNGIAPGEAGYAEAAIANRVSGVNLSVDNQSTTSANSSLAGGGLYAPFLIANGTIDEFLADNPDNTLGEELQAYFAFTGANPDQVDHIRLLGSNVFGFEDLSGGGDNDFNDIILDMNITV